MGHVISFMNIEDKWEIDYLDNSLKGIAKVRHFNESPELVINDIKDTTILSTFVNSSVTKDIIENLENLRLIATRSTGFDHIDVDHAKTKGIHVSNVPTYGENTVAEHTFALILSLARKLKESHARASKGDFSINDLMGFDLKGKTIGVIGTGHIGLRVMKIASGFGMRILAFARTKNPFLSEILGFTYADLDTILKESDIITLHVPHNKETHHLINKDNIKLIKRGAILINTARGALVDTNALTKALDEKILAGVGLDVLEGEDIILKDKHLLLRKKKDLYHPEKLKLTLRNGFLLQRDNVIFTPHTAFYSREALQRILDTTIHNIIEYIKGTPINLVS